MASRKTSTVLVTTQVWHLTAWNSFPDDNPSVTFKLLLGHRDAWDKKIVQVIRYLHPVVSHLWRACLLEDRLPQQETKCSIHLQGRACKPRNSIRRRSFWSFMLYSTLHTKCWTGPGGEPLIFIFGCEMSSIPPSEPSPGSHQSAFGEDSESVYRMFIEFIKHP